MIGKLKGQVESIYDDHVIIDTNGVGYLVFCSAKTLHNLRRGEFCELLIETHVREDHIHLYGFVGQEEKTTFSILQSVKGVGTRMALAILSHLTPNEIAFALSAEDKIIFNSVPGVGKKLAERIITELKDKFTSISGVVAMKPAQNANISNNSSTANDAIAALVNLGVNKADAQNRITSILNNSPDMKINELIRLALNN
jgi:Holliday junction DNA helicase RuvA